MYIRWMNAFRGRRFNAKKALSFELTRKSEVAAEKLQTVNTHKGCYHKSAINADWGLLISEKAVITEFNGDCWSEYQGERLVKGRNPRTAQSEHMEVFAKAQYTGIVLSQGYTPCAQELKVMVNTGLTIYVLTKGGLKPMV